MRITKKIVERHVDRLYILRITWTYECTRKLSAKPVMYGLDFHPSTWEWSVWVHLTSLWSTWRRHNVNELSTASLLVACRYVVSRLCYHRVKLEKIGTLCTGPLSNGKSVNKKNFYLLTSLMVDTWGRIRFYDGMV